MQIITTFAVILWFDLFKLNRVLLKAFGYLPWTQKTALPYYLRWIACYFCTSFWIGVIVALVYYFTTFEVVTPILLIMSNTILSRLFDYLLGYQSYKS